MPVSLTPATHTSHFPLLDLYIFENRGPAPAAFQGGEDSLYMRSASSAKSAFQLEMDEMKAREKEVKAGREAAEAATRLEELQQDALRGRADEG